MPKSCCRPVLTSQVSCGCTCPVHAPISTTSCSCPTSSLCQVVVLYPHHGRHDSLLLWDLPSVGRPVFASCPLVASVGARRLSLFVARFSGQH